MSIKFRIILTIGLIFLLGSSAALCILWKQVANNVDREVLGTVQMVIGGALAARAYTIDTRHGMRAVLENTPETFYPQTVPAYAARQITKRLAVHDVAYREAMLNPTNPANRMGTREMDLFRELKAAPGKERLTGRWSVGSKEYLYLAMPMVVPTLLVSLAMESRRTRLRPC